MEKIWLKLYPAGVPAEINANAYTSLVEVFEQSCAKYRDRPAFSNRGTVLTYGELDRLSAAFARYLQGKLGLKKGDRFAIMLPNLLQYPVAIFGALRAGLVVVNVNPLYTPHELLGLLPDSGALAILVLANFAHVLPEVLPQTSIKHVIVTEVGDLYPWGKSQLVNWVVKYVKKMVPAWTIDRAVSFKKAMLWGQQAAAWQAPSLSGDDIAFLQYTGGTTGVPKGAVLTHRNMTANLEQISAWINPFIYEGKEIVITALPLYHIFSLTANCLTFLKFGAYNVLITNPRDMKGFIKELARVRFTTITGVNTLFNALLNQPAFAQLDFSRLHVTLGGGMAVQKVVAERWHQVTGHPLIEAYGLTEACPAVTINRLDLTDYNGSIGLPIPSTEVAICNDAGAEMPVGEPGELCIRGPQVMKEYWHRPEETAQVFFPNHWFRTGDIASVDAQGLVRLIERKKDMIIVSGFNVYPHEVEEVIAEHPGVFEVAVIGVPSPASGEIVKALVVKKDPLLDAETLKAFCRKELVGYKVPKEIEFRLELPKSNVGKILRRVLRDEALATTS